MKKILLDTNAYSRLLAGDDRVLEALSRADTTYMSVFVLGELYAGFAGGTNEQKNRETLGRFLTRSTVRTLAATNETALVFGMIKSELKRAGTPIPISDVWIAAHALETGSVVVTYDYHFNKVQGLRMWKEV